MNVVGKVGNLISQGVYTVATPFHPFGGAVDIIVVQQQDGSFRTTPWYVRFGKFQGVLKRAEKLVRISVNGVEANFHMHLDNSGEAYFSREADPGEGSEKDGVLKDGIGNGRVDSKDGDSLGEENFEANRLQSTVSDPGVAADVFYSMRGERLERSESDVCHFYDFQDDQSSIDGSIEFSSEFGSNRFDNLDGIENFIEAPESDSEMILVSIDGHILTAPIKSFIEDTENVQSVAHQFHLGSGEDTKLSEGKSEFDTSENTWATGYHTDLQASSSKTNSASVNCMDNDSSSAIEKNTEDCHVEKDVSVCQRDQREAGEIDAGSVDKDQGNHVVHQLEVSEVGGEYEHENQVMDDGLNQESDLHVHNSVEGALFSPENGNGAMQSETSSVDIHEEAKFGVGETHRQQSENGLVDIHEEAQEKPAQNFEVQDADAEHPRDNHNLSIKTLKEVKARYEDEIRIDNESASSLSNSTPALNGEVQLGEEIAIGAELVLSSSLSDVINSDSDAEEAEVSVHEMEQGTLSSEELQADSDPRKDLTVTESVSDGSDSENVDPHLTSSDSHEASKIVPNGDASETESLRDEAELGTENSARLQANSDLRFEISLCRHLLLPGMGLGSAAEAFEAHRVSAEEFKISATSIIKDENLVVRLGETYLPWDKAAHIVLGMTVFGLDLPVDLKDAIPVDKKAIVKLKDNDIEGGSTPRSRWRIFSIPFRRSKTLEPSTSNVSSEDIFHDPEASHSPSRDATPTSLSQTPDLSADSKPSHKKFVRTNMPTSEQIASLNLKDGQNVVTFSFCTRVWGPQQVEAHIYLWKWNARIVISDVDGTITKSDVLGQFMPLVGRDWSQSGVAKLFSAIKENGYQLLFLSARAIVQAYLTRSFLINLKQDGKTLPDGPVVISPDGLFPSLFREVIRRAPHEFKIACLQDIKALFPADYNPFYAGFGNRDTDELSYRKIGIPKGKIFIINPKGEVAISHRIDVKSYTSLHTLVNDMFPPTSRLEQEDYNHWNYWKVPLPDIDDL